MPKQQFSFELTVNNHPAPERPLSKDVLDFKSYAHPKLEVFTMFATAGLLAWGASKLIKHAGEEK